MARAEAAVLVVAVLMGDFAEAVAMSHEQWKRFRPTLDRARFAATGAVWNQIKGDDTQEFLAQKGALLFGSGVEESLGVTASRGQAAGKAYSLQFDMMLASGLKHEPADEVVDEEVKADLALQIVRVLRAEVLHLEGDLEMT